MLIHISSIGNNVLRLFYQIFTLCDRVSSGAALVCSKSVNTDKNTLGCTVLYTQSISLYSFLSRPVRLFHECL